MKGPAMKFETFSIDDDRYYTKINIEKLKEIYGDNLFPEERIVSENLPPREQFTSIAERLARQRLEYSNSSDESYIALVAGSFDVPHDNHEWFLRHCRAAAAEQMLRNKGLKDNEIDSATLSQAIVSPNLFLMVSLDSDNNLDLRKSNKEDKGGIKRPVYSWPQRANRLAGYSFNLNDQTINTVNLVTKECRQDFFNSPLENAATLAKTLSDLQLLDGYIVFDEHQGDIANADKINCDTIIISKEDVYARDTDGKRLSSSYYINKIRGNN